MANRAPHIRLPLQIEGTDELKGRCVHSVAHDHLAPPLRRSGATSIHEIMVNFPNRSILDLVIAGSKLDKENRYAASGKCFFGSPFAQLPAADLAADVGELDQAPIRMWLSQLGHVPGVGHPWLRERVTERAFSIWALLEFAAFVADPLDSEARRRLVAASSCDSRARQELSMPFVKAAWLGYYHVVDRMLVHLDIMWLEVPRELFPTLLDWKGAASQPIDRWPTDGSAWRALADAHGHQGLRLDDSRLRVRQLVSLAGPSRSGTACRLETLGRSLVNPAMHSVRLIKDGHKGAAGALPALANLVAACAGDRLVMHCMKASDRRETSFTPA